MLLSREFSTFWKGKSGTEKKPDVLAAACECTPQERVPALLSDQDSSTAENRSPLSNAISNPFN